MYNDFLGELASSQANGGKVRKPKIGKVSKMRQKINSDILKKASETNEPLEKVSMDYVNASVPAIQRYVISKGEQPLSNPIELCVQAIALREQDVDNVCSVIGCDRDTAQLYLDEAEEKTGDINSSDADYFIGGLLGAIGNVANKGINKIVAKKEQKGKKAGFWKFLADVTNPNGGQPAQTDSTSQGGNFGNDLKLFANEILDKVKENEKKKEINKILPIAIIGVVVLILITVLVTRKASK